MATQGLCIVTGATGSIGKEIARALAARGCNIVLACRNTERAEELRRELLAVPGCGDVIVAKDINRAMRVAKAVQTGRIWVNTYNAIPAGAPFGGYKQSGIGRETHKVMLDHYSQTKNIMINLS